MAADFWVSSHYKRWIVDRTTVRRARSDDLRYVDDPDHLDYLAIYFANAITKLGKKLSLRQRVIATATVFFRRFYLKNAYCETDPFLVIAACCYVAAKAEESPVHIRTVMSDARSVFSQEMYNVDNFPTDNSKLAEMEFYLVDDLECDLTVFHPYRTLLALCKKETDDSATPATAAATANEEGEAGELGSGGDVSSASAGTGSLGVGVGADEGLRYWGTGEGKLELSAGALQTAWFIINDTYRSDICLLYPPHLIAIAAIYLTLILHAPTRATITPLLSPSSSSTPSPSPPHAPPTTSISTSMPTEEATSTSTKPRRSTRRVVTPSTSTTADKRQQPLQQQQQDPITFLSELNISLPLIATISQEIISLYTLWERYKEDILPEAKGGASSASTINPAAVATTPTPAPGSTSDTPLTTTNAASTAASMSGLLDASGNIMGGDDPMLDGIDETEESTQRSITPGFLSALVLRMRRAKVADAAAQGSSSHSQPQGQGQQTQLAHIRVQGHGQQTQYTASRMPGARGGVAVAVNKMLERTQKAAG